MKKFNNKGFVLAETLVVTVFLMTIFSMIYYYFYPLIGEYEKREVYDDVDDKYSAYWIKRIIEDSGYGSSIDRTSVKGKNFTQYGYLRFECKDVPDTDEKAQMCKTLVNALQVANCSSDGNMCDIFLTPYRIGDNDPTKLKNFKDTVAIQDSKKKGTKALRRFREECTGDDTACTNAFVAKCKAAHIYDQKKEDEKCKELANEKVFSSAFQEYVALLPDYRNASANNAKYRIVIRFKHTVDNNNFYSYATIEVG